MLIDSIQLMLAILIYFN